LKGGRRAFLTARFMIALALLQVHGDVLGRPEFLDRYNSTGCGVRILSEGRRSFKFKYSTSEKKRMRRNGYNMALPSPPTNSLRHNERLFHQEENNGLSVGFWFERLRRQNRMLYHTEDILLKR
jgi:hypothetical protein